MEAYNLHKINYRKNIRFDPIAKNFCKYKISANYAHYCIVLYFTSEHLNFCVFRLFVQTFAWSLCIQKAPKSI